MLPHDDNPEPETGPERAPAAAEPAATEPAVEPAAGPPRDRPAGDVEHRALVRDLDEVQRGKPERAFDVGLALGVLVTVAAVIFVLQNRQPTAFDWLWFDFELPLWAAFVAGIGVGIVLVLLAVVVRARRRRRIGRRREAAGRLRRALTRGQPPLDTTRHPVGGRPADQPGSPA